MTFLRAAAQQRRVNDYSGLAGALKGIGDQMEISEGGTWSAENKNQVFQFVDARLDTYFANGSSGALQHSPAHFENLLSNAITEQSAFEIKQGFLRLDDTKEFDEESFSKAIKAATAIANRGPKDSGGYLLFGVADSTADANRVAEVWSAQGIRYRDFHVVGTEHELTHLDQAADKFMLGLAKRIRSLPLPSAFAEDLIRNLRPVFYRQGKIVWIVTVPGAENAVSFDGAFYDRIGAATEQVPPARMQSFMSRFFTA